MVRMIMISALLCGCFALVARNFDGTGPRGQGPRTGRGYGRCRLTKNVPAGRDMFLGRGRGVGCGRFCGNRW